MQTKGTTPEPISQRKEERTAGAQTLGLHRIWARVFSYFLPVDTLVVCRALSGLPVWLAYVSGHCTGPISPLPRLLGETLIPCSA